MYIWASQVAQTVKNLPAMRETWVPSLGQEDTLATHFSILAWKIPWTEEPGSLQSIAVSESDKTERITLYILYINSVYTLFMRSTWVFEYIGWVNWGGTNKKLTKTWADTVQRGCPSGQCMRPQSCPVLRPHGLELTGWCPNGQCACAQLCLTLRPHGLEPISVWKIT